MKSHSYVTRALAAAALVAATLAIAPVRASATTNVYTIQLNNVDSKTGKAICLDADANHAGAGAAVNLVNCSSSSYQKWELIGDGGYPVMMNLGHSGYCLAVSTLTSGKAIEMKACSGSDHTNNWYGMASINQDKLIPNYWVTTLVLDAINPHNGYGVYLKTYANNVPAQAWRSTRLS